MKKGVIMLLGALFVQLVFSPFAQGGEDVNIIIANTQEAIEEVVHRAPASAPIVCTLEEGYLDVTFLINIGFVSVEIENLTTGEYTQTVVNSATGSAIFPISGNAGSWTITFTLSDGTVCFGEFTL